MDWGQYVDLDPRYLRPSEVDYLMSDSTKARTELKWEPRVTFRELVRIMVDADIEALGLKNKGAGRSILAAKFGDWHQWNSAVSQPLAAAAGSALGH
jgi:GDPmannose 4,6-dehydratase